MIVDTGILYALADRADKHHAAAKEIFKRREHRIIPEPVIVETDYLILDALGVAAELAFLEGLSRLAIENPTAADRARAARLARQYRDLELGYVDCVVMAMAERLRETTIATVDRRHFGAVKPAHLEAYVLLP